jgi:hypothetical protein
MRQAPSAPHSVRIVRSLLWAALACLPSGAAAQPALTAASALVIDGPPAPIPPSVVSRDTEGHVTVRAIKLGEPLLLDGRLDDRLYRENDSFGDFVQQEPREGQPATEKTEVWVGYDSDAIYVGARLWESDSSKRVTSDMRRDANNLYNNDHLSVFLDPFYDRRNGYQFMSNSQGGLGDYQITNEQGDNEWNTIWEAKAADFDGGWTVEFRIPFRSIRFREGTTTWGINIRRNVRWKSELSFLSPVEAAYGRGGLNKSSHAATLTGIEPSTKVQNLDLKAYGLGSLATNRVAQPPVSNDGNGEFGVDAKWALNQSFVADFTFNTDFAQVEDDEQQVNLTRFSLFFPEKRDFFLEGSRVFAFGGAQAGARGGNANSTNNITGAPNNTPILFFSRRIGLEGGSVVPIIGGGRLLGRAGPYQVGAVSMQTDDVTASARTSFSVLRVSRDLFSRSRVGVIATRRSPTSLVNDAANYAYGADADFIFRTNLQIVGYAAQTQAAGRTAGDDTSYRGRLDWNGDRWGVIGEHLFVGDGFEPGIGFMTRSAFRRSLGVLRFSPRPRNWRGVRKIYHEVSFDYVMGPSGQLETRELQAAFKMDLDNGDSWQVEGSRTFEGLDAPFTVAKNVTVPIGGYSFQQAGATYTFGPQRPISGAVVVRRGSFYDGTLSELSWRGRVEFSPQLYAEPTVSWNHVDTPFGTGNTNLMSSRVTYTLSPRMFVSGLVQYQSRTDTVSTNARFRWEYLPGSELFVVYSDGRTTLSRGIPDVENRSIVVKVTRLLQF